MSSGRSPKKRPRTLAIKLLDGRRSFLAWPPPGIGTSLPPECHPTRCDEVIRAGIEPLGLARKTAEKRTKSERTLPGGMSGYGFRDRPVRPLRHPSATPGSSSRRLAPPQAPPRGARAGGGGRAPADALGPDRRRWRGPAAVRRRRPGARARSEHAANSGRPDRHARARRRAPAVVAHRPDGAEVWSRGELAGRRGHSPPGSRRAGSARRGGRAARAEPPRMGHRLPCDRSRRRHRAAAQRADHRAGAATLLGHSDCRRICTTKPFVATLEASRGRAAAADRRASSGSTRTDERRRRHRGGGSEGALGRGGPARARAGPDRGARLYLGHHRHAQGGAAQPRQLSRPTSMRCCASAWRAPATARCCRCRCTTPIR